MPKETLPYSALINYNESLGAKTILISEQQVETPPPSKKELFKISQSMQSEALAYAEERRKQGEVIDLIQCQLRSQTEDLLVTFQQTHFSDKPEFSALR